MVDSKGSKKVKVSKLNINSVRGRLFFGCWLLTFSIDVIFILFGLSMNDPDILRNIAVLVVPPVVVMILSYYRPVLSVLALSGFVPVFYILLDLRMHDRKPIRKSSHLLHNSSPVLSSRTEVKLHI